jgi:hypothetical protein
MRSRTLVAAASVKLIGVGNSVIAFMGRLDTSHAAYPQRKVDL